MIPPLLRAAIEREGRQDWLAELPGIVGELEELWAVRTEAPYQPGGHTAWVAPAGSDFVVKVAWRHSEGEHEVAGLQAWDGDGVVRVHAFAEFPQTITVLLERCVPGDALACRPEPEQDEVVAGLLRRLWRAPGSGHGFRSLQAMCEQWAGEFERKAAAGRASMLDEGLAREGIGLLRSLPTTCEREVILCTDLHAGNVLAARREPWLVIDPKPHVGDPTYDALQHMLTCEKRLHTEPQAFIRRMADLLDLDPDRLRLWLFARCVQESPERPGLADIARSIARNERTVPKLLGPALFGLHRALDTYPGPLASHEHELDEVRTVLGEPARSPALKDTDRRLLLAALDLFRTELASRETDLRPVPGSPHSFKVLVGGGQPGSSTSRRCAKAPSSETWPTPEPTLPAPARAPGTLLSATSAPRSSA